VSCVGVTEKTADREVVTASFDVEETARAFVEQPPVPGRVELLAVPGRDVGDTARRLLI
jgi:hypothetical protein